jgi:hypothetical protein
MCFSLLSGCVLKKGRQLVFVKRHFVLAIKDLQNQKQAIYHDLVASAFHGFAVLLFIDASLLFLRLTAGCALDLTGFDGN